MNQDEFIPLWPTVSAASAKLDSPILPHIDTKTWVIIGVLAALILIDIARSGSTRVGGEVRSGVAGGLGTKAIERMVGV